MNHHGCLRIDKRTAGTLERQAQSIGNLARRFRFDGKRQAQTDELAAMAVRLVEMARKLEGAE